MSLWEALLLGLLQGATEFLPVSSSGHLVLAAHLLSLRPSLAFGAALHGGTLVAVIGYYRRDLWAMITGLLASGRDLLRGRRPGDIWREDDATRLALLIGLATVPTGIIGLALKGPVERAMEGGAATSAALIVTGGLLLLTRLERANRAGAGPAAGSRARARGLPSGPTQVTLGMALLVGVAQGFAVFPGISRSGATLVAALLCGVARADAARFAFLLSVPAILGALVLEGRELVALGQDALGPVVLGVLAAVGAGYLSLVFLVALVRRGGLHRFAYYVVPVGIAGLVYFLR